MPNVCLAAGLRLTVLISIFWMGNIPAWGQIFIGNPYDAGIGVPSGSPGRNPHSVEDYILLPSLRQPPQIAPEGPPTISADVLRHPLSSKVRRLLEKAMHHADLGDHPAAIQGLRETLAKNPSSAPYAQNMLGVEYVQVHRLSDAKNCFAEAIRLMPHESINYANLGYTLAITGDLDSAEQEVRKALQLDPDNFKAKAILEVLAKHKRTTHTEARP